MKSGLSLYLDESGEQRWPTRGQPRDLSTIWCHVGGVLLRPDQIHAVASFHRELLKVLSSWAGIPITWLHATDLMGRKKLFSKLSADQTEAAMGRVVAFLAANDIRIVGARNNLAALAKRRGRRHNPFLCTVESALAQADLLCRPKGLQFHATIAMGNNVGQSDISDFVSRVRTESRIGPAGIPLVGRRLDCLTEGPVFGDARQIPCLQIADTVAWLLKRDEPNYRESLRELWLIDPFQGDALLPSSQNKTHVFDPRPQVGVTIDEESSI